MRLPLFSADAGRKPVFGVPAISIEDCGYLLFMPSAVWWITLVLALITLLLLNMFLFSKYSQMQKIYDRRVSADLDARFLANCEKYKISAREMDVLRLILAGQTYKSVAGMLFISEKTVDAHLRSIYRKSGVNNKVDLVISFYR